MADDCLFCKIVTGDVPADTVHEGERVLAFRDINPQAPTHVLVVSRNHHRNVAELAGAEPETLAELMQVARQVADGDFRLVFNSGPGAQQSVDHVHGHVLAGRAMSWPPG
jgi:histidine triad (HIT) family protein